MCATFSYTLLRFGYIELLMNYIFDSSIFVSSAEGALQKSEKCYSACEIILKDKS